MDGQLNAVHPGKYEDGNPESDATDMGGALGATGDTLFALADGYQINDNVKWMRFCASLVEKGFKPAILKRTYFPDMVGLYAFFKNVTKKMGNYDSKLFVVDKIVRFPYEKSAAGDAAKGKGLPNLPLPVSLPPLLLHPPLQPLPHPRVVRRRRNCHGGPDRNARARQNRPDPERPEESQAGVSYGAQQTQARRGRG